MFKNKSIISIKDLSRQEILQILKTTQALKKNPNLIKVPCHRVVAAGGKLGGYVLGDWQKKKILAKEGIEFDQRQKIKDFEKKLYHFD